MASNTIRICLATFAAAALSACSSSSNGVALGSNSSVSSFSGDEMPPPSAVTAGNFTVWSEPASPAPFEDYRLYTKVQLPSTVTSYNSSDISGRLHGTDGYSIAFGGETYFASFTFNQANPAAVMSMQVPGASTAGVQDTITIKSKLLQETETMVLTFSDPQL